MSVLTDISEERELSAPVAPVLLPCINLLPPEIAERKAFRTLQFRLGGVVLVVAGLVGLTYHQVAGGVAPAQDRVAAAQEQTTGLQHQIAALSDVTKTRAEYQAAQAALAKAMGSEVRWSSYLNDLSLTMPANVWVDNIAIAEAAPAPAGSTSSTTTKTSAAASTGLGTLTITGKAFSYNDVAVWLETLAKQKGYTDVWLGQGAKQTLAGRTVVTFSSTVTFTPQILSQRYTKQAGN